MRRLWNILPPLMLAAGVAAAQAPLVAPPPQPAYGGYAIPQPVPYQPTLPPPSAPPTGPVNTLAAPVVITPIDGPQPSGPTYPERVWPQYPATGIPPGGVPLGAVPGDVTYSGIVPGGSVPITPEQPIYPATPEPGQGASLLPPGTRNGAFQKAKFTATWLPQLGDYNLGWTDLRTEVVFGLPFFTRETPIVITPAYELHFLDRPDSLDLPPRLHDFSIDFHHFRRLDEHWIFDAAVTPGLYADDHSFDSGDWFQISGRALGVYEASPEWKYVLGAAYWPPSKAKVNPIVGIVYAPNDDVSYELVYPQPKVSWRLPNSPVPGSDEYWLSVKMEYGGGIWAIEHSNGASDQFLSRDWRLLLGLEHKIIGDVSRRFEIGYVFNRELAFKNGPPEISLGDTLLLRAGLVY